MLRGGPAAAASRTVDPARLRPTSRIFPDVAFTAFHNSAASSKPWRMRPRFRLSQVKIQARSSKPSPALCFDSSTADKNPTHRCAKVVVPVSRCAKSSTVSSVQSDSKTAQTPAPTSARPRLFRRRRVDHVDFVVAGVQKAGTTAIHDFLAQHPYIALLRDQALHFFDKEEHFTGEPDYRILLGNFDPGWRWRVAGEVTADYFFYPHALRRLPR